MTSKNRWQNNCSPGSSTAIVVERVSAGSSLQQLQEGTTLAKHQSAWGELEPSMQHRVGTEHRKHPRSCLSTPGYCRKSRLSVRSWEPSVKQAAWQELPGITPAIQGSRELPLFPHLSFQVAVAPKRQGAGPLLQQLHSSSQAGTASWPHCISSPCARRKL